MPGVAEAVAGPSCALLQRGQRSVRSEAGVDEPEPIGKDRAWITESVEEPSRGRGCYRGKENRIEKPILGFPERFLVDSRIFFISWFSKGDVGE